MRAVAVGALFALGSTFKQVVVVDALLLSCAHVIFATRLPGGRRRALRDVLIFASIGAITWLALIGYYAATERFEIFWVSNFTNTRAYAGNPLFSMFRYLREGRFFPHFFWFSASVLGLVALGVVRHRRALGEHHWALFLTALVALQITIALNGPGFLPHYYQYWLPILAVGAGWAAGAKSSRSGWPSSAAMTAAGALVASWLLIQQIQYLSLSSEEISRSKYGSSVVEGRDLGRAIGLMLRPGERLYQHGGRPELYYYSGHLAPSLLLWSWHLNDQWPVAGMLLKRHLAALESAPPDLLVVEQAGEPRAETPPKPGLIGRLFGDRQLPDKGRNAASALEFLRPRFRPATIEEFKRFPGFQFLVRRDSELDRRLKDREGVRSSPGPTVSRNPVEAGNPAGVAR
jgi:hypothetical protein